MARTYTQNAATRVINWVFTTMTRLGLGASYRHLLTVRGRKTGRLHTTPVDVMETAGAMIARLVRGRAALGHRSPGHSALSGAVTRPRI